MTAKNTPAAWGSVSQLLHWLIALLILALGVVGLIMGLYYWIKAESPDKVATGKTWFFGALLIGVVYSLLSSAQY